MPFATHHPLWTSLHHALQPRPSAPHRMSGEKLVALQRGQRTRRCRFRKSHNQSSMDQPPTSAVSLQDSTRYGSRLLHASPQRPPQPPATRHSISQQSRVIISPHPLCPIPQHHIKTTPPTTPVNKQTRHTTNIMASSSQHSLVASHPTRHNNMTHLTRHTRITHHHTFSSHFTPECAAQQKNRYLCIKQTVKHETRTLHRPRRHAHH